MNEEETDKHNYIIVFDTIDTLMKLDKEQQESILNYSYYEKYLKHNAGIIEQKYHRFTHRNNRKYALLCVSNYFNPYHAKYD